MLNYIWSGLIVLSLLFAVSSDINDAINNTYKNGEQWSGNVKLIDQPNIGKQKAWLFLSKSDSTLIQFSKNKDGITFLKYDQLPSHYHIVHELTRKKETQPLRAKVVNFGDNGELLFELPEVHLVKMKAITAAAFDMAEVAVSLAIGLIGAMALWLGMMQIAEKSGLIYVVVKVVHPVLKFIFPHVPKNHPALGAISLNLAANMLGLGNAATPLGIKAMEELQKLNPKKDTATDAMCMFLTMNTASVQLVPPVTLVAILGVGVGEIMISIILATFISLMIGIIAAKWLARNHKEENKSQILEVK